MTDLEFDRPDRGRQTHAHGGYMLNIKKLATDVVVGDSFRLDRGLGTMPYARVTIISILSTSSRVYARYAGGQFIWHPSQIVTVCLTPLPNPRTAEDACEWHATSIQPHEVSRA